ncbi:N-acetylmuramoyl-L-alanine amidase [Aeromicrobium marinum DSM 15272]|uniref:N-acetylmuramoyl-L-alanine amidase n=1 Tax=Aeromicrobium marinum DSM 15272 TaxID=585531 RepID=E2SBN4_9ACTN|nr:N-acetylmuramoyl-L-alanine amidase [Aeromicrobium marinum]EFQ83780.1 N-acetylmuramoyl-L-alanine amidase [Aeromicrobium marinum DSM 15272]
MSYRSAALRLLPLVTATAVLSAFLVASAPDDAVTQGAVPPEVDAVGTPAELREEAVPAIAAPERPVYTPEDAAAVDIVDPVAPAITNGEIIAELAPQDLPVFELLGVVWDGGVPADDAEVQVRWRQDGVWSAWTRLEIDTQVVDGGNPGTEPRWVGPSDAAQARVVASTEISPAGLRLVTVDPGATPTITPAASVQPGIISRAAWGADNSGSCDSPRYGTMRGTIVHHTAGSNNYSAAQSAGIVKSIQAYHKGAQGWCDTGYNFLIDRYGQIFEGRAGGITQTPRGAHAGNSAVNTDTMGASLMGTFVNDTPPQAMKDALVRLIAWKHSLHGVPAKGGYSLGGVSLNRIDGHYRVKATACPGQQVINWMNAPGGLRDQVEQSIATGGAAFGVSGDIAQYWESVGGASGFVGQPVSPEIVLPGGIVQRFAGADLYRRESTGRVSPVRGAIRGEFRVVGETRSGLGWPVGPEYAIPGGAYQDYEGGRIFAKPGVGTFAIAAPVYDAHENVGNVGGPLGWPTNRAVPWGQGSKQTFENGTVYARPAGPTVVMAGGFDTAYVAAGGPLGPMGWPLGDVKADRVGSHVALEGGWVQETPAGLVLVRGAIARHYRDQGGVDGPLGSALGPERAVGTGFVQDFEGGQIQCWPGAMVTVDARVVAVHTAAGGPTGRLGWPLTAAVDEPGGFRQDFQGASVYGSSSTAGPVNRVQGGLLAVYRAGGGPRTLGFPLGEEFSTATTWKQLFERGAAYLPLNGVPGSVVSGRIWEAYVAAGADTNAGLGFPTGPARETVGGALRQRFSASEIYTSSSGTAIVRGFLRTMYLGLGAESSRLGLPLESERTVQDGAVQRFAGGTLYVSPRGAAATWGAIQAEYLRRGGPTGSLGWPVGPETSDGSTWSQRFQNGTLVMTAAGFTVR